MTNTPLMVRFWLLHFFNAQCQSGLLFRVLEWPLSSEKRPLEHFKNVNSVRSRVSFPSFFGISGFRVFGISGFRVFGISGFKISGVYGFSGFQVVDLTPGNCRIPVFRIAPPCSGTPQSLRVLGNDAFPSKRDMAPAACGTPQPPAHFLF